MDLVTKPHGDPLREYWMPDEWVCYADLIGENQHGVCTPEHKIHDPDSCGWDRKGKGHLS